MFGFSFAEFAVVALIAFIFIKPEDLPEIMHKLGKFTGKIKSYTNEISSIFDPKQTESKITKVLGDDGKYHVAFDVSELENLQDKNISNSKISSNSNNESAK